MADPVPLRGGCFCGRNQYLVVIPEDAAEQAEVYFDDSSDNRRSQAAPLTAWLRVPLTWYQSHTRSFFADETHSSIRRTYTPRHALHCQRNFCGYCGTQLSYWTERPREEAEYIAVTIGSLYGEFQRALEDLELLPEGESAETGPVTVVPPSPAALAPTISPSIPVNRTRRSGTIAGIPWFEEMIEGSRLGRVGRNKRGVGMSHDGTTRIEWEVSEWHEDGTASGTASGEMSPGKRRKIEEIGEDYNVDMRGTRQ